MVDIEQLNDEELYWEDWVDRQEYCEAVKKGFTNMSYDMWKISKYIQKEIEGWMNGRK